MTLGFSLTGLPIPSYITTAYRNSYENITVAYHHLLNTWSHRQWIHSFHIPNVNTGPQKIYWLRNHIGDGLQAEVHIFKANRKSLTKNI